MPGELALTLRFPLVMWIRPHIKQPHGKPRIPLPHSNHFSSSILPARVTRGLAKSTILSSRHPSVLMTNLNTSSPLWAIRNCPNYFMVSNIIWPSTRKHFFRKISSLSNFTKKEFYPFDCNLQEKLKPNFFHDTENIFSSSFFKASSRKS